jgi:hypothetical protein
VDCPQLLRKKMDKKTKKKREMFVKIMGKGRIN